MIDRERAYQFAYWATLAALIAIKAALVSDLAVNIQFAPHDDSLYVLRAFHLLNGEAFGPYDSHTLSKLPGISLWLAGARLLGLPHLLGVNALYAAAGLYLLAGLRSCGAGRLLCASVFALFLMNPITMGVEWLRILREPLGTGIFVALLAAMLHLFLASTGRARTWPHLLVFALTFAFSQAMREEDRLLWVALGLFALLLLRAAPLRLLAVSVLAPVVVSVALNQGMRAYVEDRYGLPILHDLGEGEFARLMAAIRSVESKKDNRLVMAPQDTLRRLREVAPEFAQVVDRLPPPTPNSFSCRLQGVCSEWSNGWMPFWIKDAAARAGLTPDLVAGQRYFRQVRERIERACERGELKCSDKGSGFIPPFELRWTRAYLQELSAVLGMAFSPNPGTVTEPPLLYNASLKLGRIYQSVTMTDRFDSLAQTSHLESMDKTFYRNSFAEWRAPLAKLLLPLGALLIALGLAALVCRWVLYPGVPEGPTLWIGTFFFAFAAIRVAALAYVAVYLGPFDPRIVFATYTGALLLSPFIIADTVSAGREYYLRRS